MSSGKRPAEEESEEEEEVVLADVLQQRKAWYADCRVRRRECSTAEPPSPAERSRRPSPEGAAALPVRRPRAPLSVRGRASG